MRRIVFIGFKLRSLSNKNIWSISPAISVGEIHHNSALSHLCDSVVYEFRHRHEKHAFRFLLFNGNGVYSQVVASVRLPLVERRQEFSGTYSVTHVGARSLGVRTETLVDGLACKVVAYRRGLGLTPNHLSRLLGRSQPQTTGLTAYACFPFDEYFWCRGRSTAISKLEKVDEL